MADDFGDRMKEYEAVEAGRRFLPLLPVVARLDGRNFSKFTANLARPYDEGLSLLMLETTQRLVVETNAVCGYTQSDEITLAWYSSRYGSQIYFDGRVQKMTSVLAAVCSVFFNARLETKLPNKARELDESGGALPVFDCRVWQVPTLEEGANVFLWREQDATKNSITMAAQTVYSHKQLDGKNGKEKQEMLFAKGINWNDYPDFFKRGSYVQRRTVRGKLTPAELVDLPEKHHARLNPDLEVERQEYRRIDMPPLQRVTNRVDAIFFGADPQTAAE